VRAQYVAGLSNDKIKGVPSYILVDFGRTYIVDSPRSTGQGRMLDGDLVHSREMHTRRVILAAV
jgi:hypothetical protein